LTFDNFHVILLHIQQQKPKNMKKFNVLFIIGVLFLTTAFILSSGCKKKEDPVPDPPTFIISATPDPNNANAVFFLFKCTTNDVKLTKIIVTDPMSLFSDPYDLQGASFLQNTVYQFGNSYIKESGTWTFSFTGNRSNDNSGFVSVGTVVLSK